MTVSHFLHSHSCSPRERGWSDNRFLYIAKYRDDWPTSFVKVGRALNPQRRMRELQACQPFWLELVATWPDAGHLELEVHRLLDAYRVPGPSREWYAISADHARGLVEGLLFARLSEPVDGSSRTKTCPSGDL